MAELNTHTGDHIFSDRFQTARTPIGQEDTAFLERVSYGMTATDRAAFEALGSDFATRRERYLDAQLAPASLDDTDCDQRLAAADYAELTKPLAQAWQDHVLNDSPDRHLPVREVSAARLIRAVYSQRQVFEMMVEFWHDHFNIYAWEFAIAPVFAHYDREVIRANALGNFRQMIETVTQSTAMMIYLDNRRSIGSDFNENFARELLELHTMGAEAYYATTDPYQVPTDTQGTPLGYCDNDVYEVARCLTGWTIRDDHWQFPDSPEYNTGEFLYFASWHDRAGKFVLRRFFPADQVAMKDGRDAFDQLCQHRATARHVCSKLIRRFIADDPPPALVESAADVFQTHWQANDQMARVLRHILSSDELLNHAGGKMRRPWESLVAALRKTESEVEPQNHTSWSPWGEFFFLLEATGHGPFRWPSPDGYPDQAIRWQAASSMGQTWRLHSRLPEMVDNGQRLMPLRALTLAALAPAQRTANAIVDYWLERLITTPVAPARRSELVDFMRQNASADAALDFDFGTPPHGAWSGNDLSRHFVGARLHALVSLILTLPEYHQR